MQVSLTYGVIRPMVACIDLAFGGIKVSTTVRRHGRTMNRRIVVWVDFDNSKSTINLNEGRTEWVNGNG